MRAALDHDVQKHNPQQSQLHASEAPPILFLEFFHAVLLIAIYLAVEWAPLLEYQMGEGNDR